MFYEEDASVGTGSYKPAWTKFTYESMLIINGLEGYSPPSHNSPQLSPLPSPLLTANSAFKLLLGIGENRYFAS
jgi:hypothetical protein